MRIFVVERRMLRGGSYGVEVQYDEVKASTWSVDQGALVFRGPDQGDPYSLVVAYGPTAWSRLLIKEGGGE